MAKVTKKNVSRIKKMAKKSPLSRVQIRQAVRKSNGMWASPKIRLQISTILWLFFLNNISELTKMQTVVTIIGSTNYSSTSLIFRRYIRTTIVTFRSSCRPDNNPQEFWKNDLMPFDFNNVEENISKLFKIFENDSCKFIFLIRFCKWQYC